MQIPYSWLCPLKSKMICCLMSCSLGRLPCSFSAASKSVSPSSSALSYCMCITWNHLLTNLKLLYVHPERIQGTQELHCDSWVRTCQGQHKALCSATDPQMTTGSASCESYMSYPWISWKGFSFSGIHLRPLGRNRRPRCSMCIKHNAC